MKVRDDPRLSSICGECDDALATTEAWFNGRTLVKLCAECWAWWENHGLIEPRDEAFFKGEPVKPIPSSDRTSNGDQGARGVSAESEGLADE